MGVVGQAQLKICSLRKKRRKKSFLFLGFATCGECSYAITAERHIKKSGLEFVYYCCTKKSKTIDCKQNRFLREEKLAEQVKTYVQKVSLPDEWRDKFLAKVKEWEKDNRHSSDLFAQNVRDEISAIKEKLERLTDAYLAQALELDEYQERKNKLIAEKKSLEEKLSYFERKGNHWLELTRNWILEANQAKNLALQENFSEMKNFLKKVSSNQKIENLSLSIFWKSPWDYLAKAHAEPRSGEAGRLSNSEWWDILNFARNHFEGN